MSQPPKLLDQVRQLMRFKHMSLSTEKSYVYYIKDYILFHRKRHPKDMGVDEVRAYLTHLAVDKNITASTQNVALSALLFLYRDVLKIDLPAIDHIEYARHSRRVPVVFTRAEVKAILSKLTGIPHLVASLLYGAGLRLNECLRLRVKDLDFEYCQITVRDGKCEKDRITPLPQSIVPDLKRQIERVRLLHEEDLLAGAGAVYLPNGFALLTQWERPLIPTVRQAEQVCLYLYDNNRTTSIHQFNRYPNVKSKI